MKNKEYWRYIDSLKGIAIIAVTMLHTGGNRLPGLFGKIGGQGSRGVQMFFLISGLLNFISAEKQFGTSSNVKIGSVGRWYCKKIFRLLPMYYFALIVSMLTKSWSVYWLGNESYVTIKNIFAHIFLVHGLFPHYTDSMLGVDWYLGVLVIFLLITPLLYKFINTLERAVAGMVIIFLLNPWLKWKWGTLLPVEEDPTIYNTFIDSFGPLTQILVYFLGIVVFFLLKEIENKENMNRRLLSYMLLIFSLSMLWGQIEGFNNLFRLSDSEMYGIWFAIILISQALYSTKLIDNILFRTCGKYSYGMYLFQFIWLNFYERYIHYSGKFDWTVKFLSSVAALLTISWVVTKYIDSPIQKKVK